MNHDFSIRGLCLTCGKVCWNCNQCKCEIGRKRTCPYFDVKKNPQRFEEWKREREEDKTREAVEIWAGKSGDHLFDCPIEDCTIGRRERDILCVKHYKMIPYEYRQMLFEKDESKLRSNLAVVFGYIDDKEGRS